MIAISPDLAQALESVADEILWLAPWLEEKKRTFKPEGHESWPWRQAGSSLSVSNLGVIKFLEGLILETSNDAEVKARFASRAEEPLALAPFDNVAEWRSLRGLEAEPSFGIFESDNTLMDVEGHPISRNEFYQLYLPLFSEAVSAARSAENGEPKWKEFTEGLWTDKSNYWPVGLGRRSSTFLRQWGRDVLYAVLGMRNPVPEPWQTAILSEIGEHRRIGGNGGKGYSVEYAKSVLDAFKLVFDADFSLTGKPIKKSAWTFNQDNFPPVGAPSLSSREQQI